MAPASAEERSVSAGRVVLSGGDIDRALTRIAHEILEANRGPEGLVLLGIPRRGYPLAVRLAAKLAAADPGVDPAAVVGQLDITMFRDDLSRQPTRPPARTILPAGGIDDKVVVLVDDVLFSGRTIRAALDALVDLGRPRSVRLAVLVDRGHRELPIRADHVGKNLPTSRAEKVRVRLAEVDVGSGFPEDLVAIEGPEEAAR
ncbi:bifunctional pyr operon transcriptional regulator/uracil phosphoribosyltransferase PyrR [Sinomonas atrocyanea]|uniref:bifunctional pyr operon transcriptional regulator/uracil phosphoribosyltransferase PyrR n=1 Tax=Sinomonas atrocyanea TaxID=37927 RepID=UPI00277D8827|nr:bifunctional pyr operon transcriptional regulator/uracil phosphoribosyltransferase PyrR [Sinomonas atrocyanea]MDQ0261838.1 pyrimidine operon attenuation protein/uracil phosphoribosyltransferase [Sinomonas atrocyanea]MDR6623575.1 pyrimidine operon attenuation protein/uracil phosphoribosyltransferase [Sinomonas atrocyanea]